MDDWFHWLQPHWRRHKGGSPVRHLDGVGLGVLMIGAVFGVLAVTDALDWPYAGVVCWVLLFAGLILRGLGRRAAEVSGG